MPPNGDLVKASLKKDCTLIKTTGFLFIGPDANGCVEPAPEMYVTPSKQGYTFWTPSGPIPIGSIGWGADGLGFGLFRRMSGGHRVRKTPSQIGTIRGLSGAGQGTHLAELDRVLSNQRVSSVGDRYSCDLVIEEAVELDHPEAVVGHKNATRSGFDFPSGQGSGLGPH